LEEATELFNTLQPNGDGSHHRGRPWLLRPSINCEDCGILAGAGFVSFISLFDGALILERHVFDDLPKAYPASLLTDDALCPNARDDRAAIVPNGDPSFVS
jgi:hypothetical protein